MLEEKAKRVREMSQVGVSIYCPANFRWTFAVSQKRNANSACLQNCFEAHNLGYAKRFFVSSCPKQNKACNIGHVWWSPGQRQIDWNHWSIMLGQCRSIRTYLEKVFQNMVKQINTSLKSEREKNWGELKKPCEEVFWMFPFPKAEPVGLRLLFTESMLTIPKWLALVCKYILILSTLCLCGVGFVWHGTIRNPSVFAMLARLCGWQWLSVGYFDPECSTTVDFHYIW